ncbi:SLAP domain-containing protein [Virgibacillus ainsalahensis]
MQELQFEEKWEQALPDKDREKIIKVFEETKRQVTDEVTYIPLWNATNYLGDLLISVLVQNGTDETIKFENKTLTFNQHNQTIASNVFTIPRLEIPAKTSVPWAFIFPKDKMETAANMDIPGKIEAPL